MNKLRSMIFLPVAAFAFAGAAHALDITYENDPNARGPLKPVTEQQRQTDLALGNCLKANGGRMAPRCAALRSQSDREEVAARASGDTAPPVIVGQPQVIPGPVIIEPPHNN